MKRVFSLGSLLVFLCLMTVSCGKDPKIEQNIDGESTGSVSLQLGTMGSFEVITKAGEEVDVREFTVNISGKTIKDNVYDSTWVRYGDMPSVVTIPAGTYTIEAYNGEQKSGFGTPYFYGKKEFTVGIQEIIDAQVTCQLACVKVSVEFTALFRDNVSEGYCLVHQTDGAILEFDLEKNEVPGYIAVPADSTLAVTVRGKYVDGTEVDRTYFIHSVNARQWHKIALSVNTSAGIENGGGMIQVDHQVDEKESTILVPGADDVIDNNGDTGSWDDEEKPLDPEQPQEAALSMKGISFNGSEFNVDEPIVVVGTKEQLEANLTTLNIELKASDGGIQKLYLQMESTESGTQAAFGGMGKMDLANPGSDPNAQMVVNIMGMDANPVKGKTSYVFAIGGFMTVLPAPEAGEGVEYHEHKFYITIEDGAGNSLSKTLIIRRKEA